MTLEEYWRICRRYWVLLVGLTLAGLALATVFTWTRTPEYTATAKTFVIGINGGTQANGALDAANVAQQKAVAWMPLVTSEIVAKDVIDKLGLQVSPPELAARIDATASQEQPVITVKATAPTAREAQTVANAVVEASAKEARTLDPYSGAQMKSIAAAQLPTSPSYPRPSIFIPLGGLLGLLIGAIFAMLRSRFDTTVRTKEEIERETGTSVIGILPDSPQLATPSGQLSTPAGDFAARESLRQLRTNLRFVDVDKAPRSIVVTSSRMGEGKSTVASSLAWVLADTNDDPVVLIDADLRRPAITAIFDLDPSVGLTHVLSGSVELGEAIQSTQRPGLFVIPAGQVPPNPSELLGSRRMAALIERLSQTHRVVIDAPPLLPVTDAALLTAVSDGAILVIASQETHREQLHQSVASIQHVGGRVLGTVLNRVNTKRFNKIVYGDPQFGHGAYGTYGDRYEVAPPSASRRARRRDDVTGPVRTRDARD